MKKFIQVVIFLMVSTLLLAACQSGESDETAATAAATTEAEEVAVATQTPAPTEPPPTDTPAPTETPPPTDTPIPTDTPLPTEPPPTETAAATETKPAKAEPTATPDKSAATAEPDKSTPEAEDSPTTPLEDDPITDTDPLELIIEAENRATRLETTNFSQNVRVEAQGFVQSITQTCGVRLPEDGYCVVAIGIEGEGIDPIVSEVEVVILEGQTWTREEGGDWEEQPPDLLESQGFSSENISQLKLSQFIIEAEFNGETTIEDVPVYEISFTLDLDAYMAFILGEEMAEIFTQTAESTNGEGRLWIGQEDLLTRKAFVEMAFSIESETMTVTTQAGFFGFNEPIDIPDPTAE